MNSADRSIAQIDVALRRRFHFVRMDPDTEVLRRNLLKWMWLLRSATGWWPAWKQ